MLIFFHKWKLKRTEIKEHKNAMKTFSTANYNYLMFSTLYNYL